MRKEDEYEFHSCGRPNTGQAPSALRSRVVLVSLRADPFCTPSLLHHPPLFPEKLLVLRYYYNSFRVGEGGAHLLLKFA